MVRLSRKDLSAAGMLFLGLLVVYVGASSFHPINDARVNAVLADSLLREGNFSFSKSELPEMFAWEVETSQGPKAVEVSRLDDSLRELVRSGTLHPAPQDDRYRDVVASTTDPALYANTFCPGSALAALPVLAPISLLVGGLDSHPCALWTASRWVASLYVAGSAALLFLLSRPFLSQKRSICLCIAYGLGTAVWSISSQALWQHGPNAFFLTAAAFYYTRIATNEKPMALDAVLLALALSAATWCRPTSAIVVLFLGIRIAVHHNRFLVPFAVTGLPFAVLLMAYNLHYFGSPFVFGQTQITVVAVAKTGQANIFQTPIWVGAAGLLLSPSRGLFVYSPFLIFSVWGGVEAWLQARWSFLRPLVLSVLAIWCIEFQHFDWWGGWSYGYRHLADTCPYLVLFLIPVFDRILNRAWLRWPFLLVLAWSILVQAIGAVAYDFQGWNGREVYLVTRGDGSAPVAIEDLGEIGFPNVPDGMRIRIVSKNIDLVENRDRLWSWRDNQICFHIRHFLKGRQLRKERADQICDAVPRELADTYASLGRAYLAAGDLAKAAKAIEQGLSYSTPSASIYGAVGALAQARGENAAAIKAWRMAQSLSPYMTDTNLELALALIQAGEFAEGEKYLHAALRFNPEHAKGLEALNSLRDKQEGPP